MELLGVKEVCDLLGVGRKTATHLLANKHCPTLPRKKGQTYRVEKEAFVAWIKGEEK